MTAITWRCEKCQSRGRVAFAADSSLMDVLYELDAVHAECSPACQTEHDLRFMRVTFDSDGEGQP